MQEVAKRKSASLIAARCLRAVPASFSSDGSSPGADVPGIRRRRVHQRTDHLGEPGEVVLELRQGPGVGGGVAADLGLRGGDVVAEQQPLAVGKAVERRAGGVDLDPALGQLHVPPDGLAQHADHVGAGRRAEAGSELLGHAGAADELAPLEDQRLQARLRQVEAGDEAVVAPADDHGVVTVRGGHQLSSLLILPRR